MVSPDLRSAHLFAEGEDLGVAFLHPRCGLGHAEVEGQLDGADDHNGEHDGDPPGAGCEDMDVFEEVLEDRSGAGAVVEADLLEEADIFSGGEDGRDRRIEGGEIGVGEYVRRDYIAGSCAG